MYRVGQKSDPPALFAKYFFLKIKSFETKYYKVEGSSYLRIINDKILPTNFNQNKSYATFSESTPCFLTNEKRFTL